LNGIGGHSLSKADATITIIDKDGNEFECLGTYFGNGRATCEHNGVKLVVDPREFCQGDAKRLYSAEGWTEFRVKTIVLRIKKEK
jgi:hypothetical protein